MSQSGSRGGPGAVGYVFAVLLLVALMVAGAWWFTRGGGTLTGEGNTTAFEQAMASGKTFYDKNDTARAISAFQSALAMNPANPDAHLNLANAFLRNNQPDQSATHAREALHFEAGNATAAFVLGCAQLRQNQFSNSVQSLQQAKDADPTVNAVSFQLGRAYFGWGKFEDAVMQFREVLQFETNQTSIHFIATHYLLSQALLRLGQRDEAQQLLATHQKLAASTVGNADNPALYERCIYTEIKAPFPLEQPDRTGITVKFVDDTARAFAGEGAKLSGPFGVLDINRRGWNDLLLRGPEGFQLLWNSNGVFAARGQPVMNPSAALATSIAIGDLQNDRYEDAVLVGPAGTTVLKFATNGLYHDATRQAGVADISGSVIALADLDFTGKLGLLVAGTNGAVRGWTNLGTGVFRQRRTALPLDPTGVLAITVDDWNNDDLPDLLLVRSNQPPLVIANVRGAGLSATNQPADWPVAAALATGDFNNDLRVDVALVTDKSVDLYFAGLKDALRLPARGNRMAHVRAFDFDNDGWLDLLGWGGDGVRVWRNRGNSGFHEVTPDLGLGALAQSEIRHLAAADFDQDCDTDLVLDVASAGVKFLRNDGGQANGMLKLRLLGNRSNASGLGVKVELTAGGWHSIRTVQSLPAEIGVGKRTQLDSVSTRWFDTRLDTTEVLVNCREPLIVFELVMPTGSCPYLYAWDGEKYCFVTDLLGAAPIGLPMAPGRYIEADPEELAWVGNETNFKPRDGHYELQVTEELREILYLDVAKLVVVDHPPGTEVHPTSKLLPGKPFVPHELWQLGGRMPLRAAAVGQAPSPDSVPPTPAPVEATAALRETDGVKVSPLQLRGPQYRGLAEPFSVTLDFGPLDHTKPLVLALNGWLRFGGGMANIAGAHNPDFPFPFPTLEAETASGWQTVAVTVGAPAGKTKTILADLTGKLPAGTKRLRLTQAFEIHWDRIALFTERTVLTGSQLSASNSQLTSLSPTTTDLHWRGYSEFADLPWTEPLTPVYDRVKPSPAWHITPSGWATRYGPVGELVAQADNGLTLVAGGDELTLKFAASALPPKPAGMVRDFFFHTIGWDKDADYHVARGTEVGPLPWTGMDDQRYGKEERPKFPSDVLHERFNTRWVGERTFVRKPRTP
jgi:Flp pilus assembly protein TadD